MLHLISVLWGFMLAALVVGVCAGWWIAETRAKPRWRILEDERRYLRAEALGFAGVAAPAGEQAGLRRRIADLEHALAEARGRGAETEVLRLRIAELERAGIVQPRAVAALDVTEYTSKIASLEADLASARAGVPFASLPADQERIASLDSAYKAAQAKIEELGRDLNAARMQAADADAIRARIAQLEAAPPPAPADDVTLLTWRNRYLGERVRYLEAHAPAATIVETPPVDTEQADRARWRMRYLEQRLAYVEQGQAEAPPAASEDAAPLKARIAELEQSLAAAAAVQGRADDLQKQLTVAEQAYGAHVSGLEQRLAESEQRAQANADLEHEATRARWKARYLEARVRFLESRAVTPAPAPQPIVSQPAPEAAAPPRPPVAPPIAPAPTPAPQAPPQAAPRLREPEVFRMERPKALSAPRGGAADDLRLISGVTGQVQSSLNAIGIFHFDQLAEWSTAHVAWVDQYLNLRGRIGAERWVEQAQRLARGQSANLAGQNA
jgi:predicted flap endonuclease-1-like 5' DNA nuclease